MAGGDPDFSRPSPSLPLVMAAILLRARTAAYPWPNSFLATGTELPGLLELELTKPSSSSPELMVGACGN